MAKEYKVSVSLPLSKDLVTRVLKRTKFRTLDEYLNAKLQEDLERLT
tara:strand:- start:572 stop:712 length:141 start_codon:yes stop_codon:yes gene_type:complete